MSRPGPKPPGLSRRLLEWAARRLSSPELADDAAEMFAERAGRQGQGMARRWYRLQVRSALGRALVAVLHPLRWTRSVRPPAGFALDAKLGVRMLVRYPGLTLVGGLAMAFAIFIGAGTFEYINQMLDPDLPLPEGERLVGLRYWDRTENEPVLPLTSDLRDWSAELRTVRDLGGFRETQQNLALGDEAGEPVRIARISPAGFAAARVRPLLGRALMQADGEPDASEVVVLGYHLWQSRFGGDPGVIGRVVRVGAARATVVGVMPEGFAFPRDQEIWAPLRLDGSAPEGDAPVRVFGRLAPGASIEEARAELSALAERALREEPERRRRLAAQVLPYVQSLSGISVGLLLRAMIYQLNVLAALFLVLVSANVALLMFARAAAREREILVRNALGASRTRILTQLFVEALVLATLATALGVAATGPGLGWLQARLRAMGGELPFWFDTTVSPATAIYAGLLTLLGAVVAGVVPALKVTGRGMHARLRQAGAGAGGLRLGGIWTGIMVIQIAATVVFAGVAYVFTRQAARSASVEAHFPADQYIGMRLEMDGDPPAPQIDTSTEALQRRYAAHVLDAAQRLAEHPEVAGVTVAERLPLKTSAAVLVELDEGGTAPLDPGIPGHSVLSGAVDPRFFELFGTPVLSGRDFDSRDLAAGANAVVVNASFIEEVLGGRNPIGRRIRYLGQNPTEDPGPWYEIVGVVRDLVAAETRSLDLAVPPTAHVYHPLEPARAGAYPLHIVARIRNEPGAVAATLYRTIAAVNPTLRLHDVQTLDRVNADLAVFWRLWADLVLMVSAVALLLALAGIYAVMSFTVSRRTREIGIRVALGARPPRVAADIFRRPLSQMGTGVAVGCVLVAVVVWNITGGRAALPDLALLLALGTAMLAVCALACAGPTARALRIHPAQAIGAEE